MMAASKMITEFKPGLNEHPPHSTVLPTRMRHSRTAHINGHCRGRPIRFEVGRPLPLSVTVSVARTTAAP